MVPKIHEHTWFKTPCQFFVAGDDSYSLAWFSNQWREAGGGDVSNTTCSLFSSSQFLALCCFFFKKRYLGRKSSYYKNRATNNSTCHSSYWAKILVPGFFGGFWSGYWMLLGKATSSSEVLAITGQSNCPIISYSKWQSYSLPKYYICKDCQYGKPWLRFYFY